MRFKQKQLHIPKINPSIQVAAALGLFVICIILSRGADMTVWEIDLFYSIYTWPDILRPFFFIITQTGSIYALGLLLLFFAVKCQYHIVLRLLLTATLAYQLSGIAKDLWGRARPTEVLTNVVNLDYIVRGPGFPSGHVALATAMALTVALYLPKKYQWIIPVWIVGVSLSRIYLGIHAPLDVIAGFAIGWLSYALFRHVRLQDIRYGKRRPAKAKP